MESVVNAVSDIMLNVDLLRRTLKPPLERFLHGRWRTRLTRWP